MKHKTSCANTASVVNCFPRTVQKVVHWACALFSRLSQVNLMQEDCSLPFWNVNLYCLPAQLATQPTAQPAGQKLALLVID